MIRDKRYPLIILGASQRKWGASCARQVLPGDICTIIGLERTQLEPLACSSFTHRSLLEACGWLAAFLSRHTLGVVGPRGIGQELIHLHQAWRVVVRLLLVGYQQAICLPGPSHERWNHSGSFRQHAAICHLNYSIPCLLCPADLRTYPVRGGCTGGRVW